MSSAPLSSSGGRESMQGQIVIYSIIGCPHCIEAKNTLQDKKLPYTDVSVDR